jgi:Fic family protein
MFTPTNVTDEIYFVSGRACADSATAEIELVRAETALLEGPYSLALRELTAFLEAISTVRIDGQRPNLRTLFELKYAVEGGRIGIGCDHESCITAASGAECGDPKRRDTLAALRYKDALEWCATNVKPGKDITPETILEIHSRCRYGEGYTQSNTTFRKAAFAALSGDKPLNYHPPAPERVEALVEDLCSYINRDTYSPITQSAIAHFQFEGIKPFKKDMDRTGRAMCHAIFFHRGFMRGTITPISLLPTLDTRIHAQLLLPYDTGDTVDDYNKKMHAVNLWISFCARAALLAAKSINILSAMVAKLEEYWQGQVGKVTKGSITEELLRLLPANPILTVNSAMALTGHSFSSANTALNRLSDLGVLTVSNESHQKTRLFKAEEALDAFTKTTETLISEEPIARNRFTENSVDYYPTEFSCPFSTPNTNQCPGSCLPQPKLKYKDMSETIPV